MTKWTKGRWWIAGRWDGSCYMCMGDMRNGPHKQFDIGLDWDNESDRADAHLIAAAPELYEVLEWVEQMGLMEHGGGGDMIRRVLAKARGEQ